jgi:hypothetical protein
MISFKPGKKTKNLIYFFLLLVRISLISSIEILTYSLTKMGFKEITWLTRIRLSVSDLKSLNLLSESKKKVSTLKGILVAMLITGT